MAKFLANESGTGLAAQLQSSIRVGSRRTDTGVTHAAMKVRGVSQRIRPRSGVDYA